MPGEEGGHTLRRSSRKRKEISYKDLISPAAEDNTSPEPEFIDENDDDEPTFKPINKKQSLRNTTTSEIPSPKVGNKRSANAHATKEGRLHSMGGTDESVRIIVRQRMEKWRDVLRKVPEELLDYTIGWGICTGDWNGEYGTRQKMEMLDSDTPGLFKPVQRTTKLTLGPKSSRNTLELLPYDVSHISTSFPKKRGHIINIGQPIWALDFLPQPPTPDSPQTQYIAVSGHPTFDSHPKIYTRDTNPNAIQIWAIEPPSLTTEGKCYLASLVCHSWGSCWGLKFCPYGAYGNGRVGLLAGVFGDGVIRVVDVPSEWLETRETKNMAITEAAWEFSFGNDFFGTCVSWKSHTEIIVGCSNGFVAIFDLSDDTDDYNIPSFYSAASDTYILSIISLAPQHPNFIGIASFDGAVQIIDIRSPGADAAHVLRQRGLSSVITTIPFWRGILSADEISGVRYSCFRPLKKGTMLVVHESAIWDIAASQGSRGAGVHGLVLSAGGDGVCNVVSATNRLFGGAKRSSRMILFRMEKDDNGFKMTEEFGIEAQDLQKAPSNKVFDDEVAITKVTWCMNPGYSGWYAAGMRSGFLRIEDLNSN